MESERVREITQLPSDAPVFMGDRFLRKNQSPNTDSYLHFCMNRIGNVSGWDLLCKMPINKQVLILVAPLQTMLARKGQRLKDYKKGLDVPRPPCRVEYRCEMYEACIEQLKKHNFPYQYVDVRTKDYQIISEDEAWEILNEQE